MELVPSGTIRAPQLLHPPLRDHSCCLFHIQISPSCPRAIHRHDSPATFIAWIWTLASTPRCRVHLAPGTAAPDPPHTSACDQTPSFLPAGSGATTEENKPFSGSWYGLEGTAAGTSLSLTPGAALGPRHKGSIRTATPGCKGHQDRKITKGSPLGPASQGQPPAYAQDVTASSWLQTCLASWDSTSLPTKWSSKPCLRTEATWPVYTQCRGQDPKLQGPPGEPGMRL